MDRSGKGIFYMKKWIAAVLLCLMMTVAAEAMAFDLASYVINANEMLLEYSVKRNHTTSVEWDGEKQELLVFNDDGVLLCRQPLGMRSRYDVAASADHPQGGYLVVLVRFGQGNADETMTLCRLDESGRILWDSAIPKGFSWNWDVLCDDGQGGAYFVFADPEDYKLAQVWHWDAQGNFLWNRVIEAEGMIFSGFTGRFSAERDRLVVAGHAVSKSKGVYDVLVLEIDREGNMQVVQRKDFSSRPDYGFDVLMDQTGAFYAHSRAGYLNTSGTPRILVPVDALPDAPAGTVVLRQEAKPETYYYNADGGRKYHVQQYCGSIDTKYHASMRAFDADVLLDEPYNALEPCSYCGADKR